MTITGTGLGLEFNDCVIQEWIQVTGSTTFRFSFRAFNTTFYPDSADPAIELLTDTGDGGVGNFVLEHCKIRGGSGANNAAVLVQSAPDGANSGDSSDRHISHCHLQDSDGDGITLDGLDRVNIHHNRFGGNARHQLVLNDSHDYDINDNEILGEHSFGMNLDTDDTYDGIRITGNSDRGNIHDNHIKETTLTNKLRYAINLVDATISGTQIHHNYGDGGKSGFLNNGATATEITDKDRTITRFSNVGTAIYDGSNEYRAYFPVASTIVSVSAALGAQPTGSTHISDVNKNGTTIFTTQTNRPTIAVSTNFNEATLEVVDIAAGEYLTMDIDQVGSTITGEFFTLTVVTETA